MNTIDNRGLAPYVSLLVAAMFAASAGDALADWSQRFPTNKPDGRSQHAMACDHDNEEVVLFGGGAAAPLGDTWAWDGDDWGLRQPAHSPGPRIGHAMAWFAGIHRIVLFGGKDTNTVSLDDTWEWTGTDWVRVPAVTSPSPRHFHAVAYDSARGRLVLFGGKSTAGALSDTWEFDGAVWRSRQPATPPPARYQHAMAYDEVRQRVVLFGGTNDSNDILGDTWEWNGASWTRRTPPSSPEARYGHAMAYDAERARVALYGGRWATKDLGDAWEWDGANWVQRPLPSGPAARRHHGMTYDRSRNRLLLFGGSGSRRDHWELSPVDSSSEIACGTGAGGNGIVDIFGGPLTGMRAIAWRRLPWEAYDTAVGQTRPACGDLDDDPWDEMVVGIGPYPGSGGYAVVMDDGLHGHAVLRWLRVPWAAYNQAEGSTRPACGDLDGDGRAEIVVGLGPHPANGGFFLVFGNTTDSYALRKWGRVRWTAYNAANGETRPACGDIDDDGLDEIVVGLGRYARNGGYAFTFDDADEGYAFLRTIRLDWTEYNTANGETWPACGNVDDDDADEVLLGIGRFPGSGGRCRVLDDAEEDHAPLAWLGLGWQSYTDANGEVRPATGELDGTVGDEVVLGLGAFPAFGGWFTVFDPRQGVWVRLAWGHILRQGYNSANGETWPAIGKLR
ncbi:MAG: kelch repeat-containing protein [Planctomycetota bacterium]